MIVVTLLVGITSYLKTSFGCHYFKYYMKMFLNLNNQYFSEISKFVKYQI